MRRFAPLLCLLLSAALLWLSLTLGCSGLRTVRKGSAAVYLPPVTEGRKAPGIVLCGAGREMAVELSRRGYAVVRAPAEQAEAAYELLCSREEVNAGDIGLIARGARAGEALLDLSRRLSTGEKPSRALILLRWEPDNTEGLANVLVLSGSGQGELEGYFAESSARLKTGSGTARQDLRHVIEWMGSSLGHPRDGVLADDELLLVPVRLCTGLSLLSAAAGLALLCRRKSSNMEA